MLSYPLSITLVFATKFFFLLMLLQNSTVSALNTNPDGSTLTTEQQLQLQQQKRRCLWGQQTPHTSKLEEAITSNSKHSPVMLSTFDLKRKVWSWSLSQWQNNFINSYAFYLNRSLIHLWRRIVGQRSVAIAETNCHLWQYWSWQKYP